jgi:beta-glucosidase-like glycosyl hydrolase
MDHHVADNAKLSQLFTEAKSAARVATIKLNFSCHSREELMRLVAFLESRSVQTASKPDSVECVFELKSHGPVSITKPTVMDEEVSSIAKLATKEAPKVVTLRNGHAWIEAAQPISLSGSYALLQQISEPSTVFVRQTRRLNCKSFTVMFQSLPYVLEVTQKLHATEASGLHAVSFACMVVTPPGKSTGMTTLQFLAWLRDSIRKESTTKNKKS